MGKWCALPQPKREILYAHIQRLYIDFNKSNPFNLIVNHRYWANHQPPQSKRLVWPLKPFLRLA